MATHGKDAYFAIADSGGVTIRDLSDNLNSIDFNQEKDVHDNTTFGASGHTFQGGLTNGTISLGGFWDETALTGTETVLAALVDHAEPVPFEYAPQGNVVGNVLKTGLAVVESYSTSTPVGDLVSFTATLRISGPVTTDVVEA